jgi:hypothetical protein
MPVVICQDGHAAVVVENPPVMGCSPPFRRASSVRHGEQKIKKLFPVDSSTIKEARDHKKDGKKK